MTELALPRSTADVAALVGASLGPSRWRRVAQLDVDAFSALSGDDNWIHTDVERARRTPFGGTVVHGNLLLALLGGMRGELLRLDAFEVVLNRGWRDVVYASHVPVGAHVRARLTVVECNDLDGPFFELVDRMQLEVEGRPGDACCGTAITWAAERL